MMKFLGVVIIGLLAVSGIMARSNLATITDGPYVSYTGDQVIVTAIKKDDDQLVVDKHSFGVSNKSEVILKVAPEGRTDLGFEVHLKSEIIPENAVYPGTGKAFFLSDIEGEFEAFRKLLLAGGVIDAHYAWTFGKGSLVIAGDLFDRGKDVVPELWLLYKLEQEADAAGGKVHVTLGNHDIMNLSGDHRYTDAKYFKSAWLLKTDCSGLFGKDTELGRWLRSKNIVEKIGDLLVMHGGISPAVNALSMPLAELNRRCQPFYDQANSANNISDKALLPLFAHNTAPFWYRGYFMTPKISPEELDRTLRLYDSKRVIVGHTIVKKLNPALYYEGKVLGLDVDEHTGDSQGVLLEDGKWQVIDVKGHRHKLTYHPPNDLITDEDIL